MANVYSHQLYVANNLTAGSHNTGGVPTGFVWVVREMRFYNEAPTGTSFMGAGGGIKVLYNATTMVYRTPPLQTMYGRMYIDHGHLVLPAGDFLNIITDIAGWDAYISGYQLTLP